jgi:hypothetical protein
LRKIGRSERAWKAWCNMVGSPGVALWDARIVPSNRGDSNFGGRQTSVGLSSAGGGPCREKQAVEGKSLG